MFVPLRRLAYGLALALGLGAAIHAADSTDSPATPETPETPVPVASSESSSADDGTLTLWEALERPEELDVKFIARDAKAGWLYVKNFSPNDVKLELPTAFVAEPQAPENRKVARKDETQVLGGGFAHTARSDQTRSEGARRAAAAKKKAEARRVGLPAEEEEPANEKEKGPVYLVRGKRSLHLTVGCVCLEYGQPEPHPQITYKIRPAETFTTQAELVELLQRYGKGKLAYDPVQAAAWHLSNHLSWEELASKRHGDEPLLSKDALVGGKALVLEIEKHVRDNPPPQQP